MLYHFSRLTFSNKSHFILVSSTVCYNKAVSHKQTDIVTYKAFDSLIRARMWRQSVKMKISQ